ncbi:serine hydrolase domain-containing protein [Flagellimonas myxillae]|uniref:serine hydrolase domain-containing protein n=1 Tax=Flagellimonas myxillae TaxID=2942214 RepID=UPI00201F8F21|nr:serine hydrolase domain-containing protein [Muricauda myxillae]MCL6265156.1 beta-lactamase family protein [Muricauda myxillae]
MLSSITSYALRILSLIFIICQMACSSGGDDTSPDPNSNPNPDPDPNPTPELTIEEKLQDIIDEKVGTDADKLVGVSVSVRIGDQEHLSLTGGISKLGVTITENMRFGVGSITKTVVAATVMKLVDEGILDLEDTIADWLELTSENVDSSITIYQLLTHSSGLFGYMYNDLWAMAEADLDTPIPQETLYGFIGPPVGEPGFGHEYSNSNYLILGLIIEAATEKTVGEVMREKFWTPLELDHMYFGTNEPIEGTWATPWRDSDDDGVLEDIEADFGPAFHSIFYCAADVFATASDLSMWAQHLYNGDAVSEASRTNMTTAHFDIPDDIFVSYGLGTREVIFHGRSTYGHTGGMRGYGAYMFFEPTSKVSIAMLNNQSRSDDGPLLRYELVNEILEEVFDHYDL